MEIFNPNHPNANIHGMVEQNGSITCKTRNGLLCTGCCTGLRIEEDGVLLKEEGFNCPAQMIAQGCKHVINNQEEKRFNVCPKYHCSSDIYHFRKHHDIEQRQRLGIELLSCLVNREIGKSAFDEASRRLLGE